MQQFKDKIEELKSDTSGIYSTREITKLYIDFLQKPEEVAELISKRGGDLGKIGEDLKLGLSSKLSRPVAMEQGKKTLLFQITSRIAYFVSLYDYVINEVQNIEEKIDQTYKLVSTTNQQDLPTRRLQYNADQLSKEYMLKQLATVVDDRNNVAELEGMTPSELLGKVLSTLGRIGKISLSEVEQSIIRHTNNYDMIDKEFKTYLGAETLPKIVFEELEIPVTKVLRGEKEYIEYIKTQEGSSASDSLPILDAIIDAIPNAAKSLYSAVTDYKEFIDQLVKRINKGKGKYKQITEMFSQRVEEFTKEPVTPESISNTVFAFTTILKNFVIADLNAIGMAHKYAHVIVNHILVYIYIGNLIDLILISGTIGKNGKNPYAEKQEKKAAILVKLGDLNTVPGVHVDEPNKNDEGEVEQRSNEVEPAQMGNEEE